MISVCLNLAKVINHINHNHIINRIPYRIYVLLVSRFSFCVAFFNLFLSLCYHVLENNWTLSVKSVTSLNKIATTLQQQQQNNTEPSQASVHSCPRCDKAYTYKKNLWRHLRFECGRLPTEKCQHCHYVARYKHSLNMHMRTQHPDQSTGLPTARGLFESRGKLVWPQCTIFRLFRL